LQVSYVVLAIIAIFVVVAWLLTEQVWVAFGSDPVIAKGAGYYSSVLALGIPGVIAFSQISQFFSAQRIMRPEVQTASIGLLLNLLLGLIFVLGFPIPDFHGFGFVACPIVTTTIVYAQMVFLYVVYIHFGRLHETCWAGWNWKEITKDRIRTYSNLYFPSAFGMASDFWRVAVIGAVAAKLGEEEVAVFNTSYRIMWIVLIMVNAVSGAAGIKIAMRLGNLDARGAKQAGDVGIGLSALILLCIFFAVLSNTRLLGRIFTEDENFLSLFEEARWPFALTLCLMNLSVAIERVPYSMGRTTEVFWMGLLASWGVQVPGVVVLTNYWRDDLVGLYWGMTLGYFVLCILYAWITFTCDWEHYAIMARQRSEAKD
jgi:Na+-driven multidrug efflux pump